MLRAIAEQRSGFYAFGLSQMFSQRAWHHHCTPSQVDVLFQGSLIKLHKTYRVTISEDFPILGNFVKHHDCSKVLTPRTPSISFTDKCPLTKTCTILSSFNVISRWHNQSSISWCNHRKYVSKQIYVKLHNQTRTVIAVAYEMHTYLVCCYIVFLSFNQKLDMCM